MPRAGIQPSPRAIWPVGFAPSAIPTVRRKPERVHQVSIEADALLAQTKHLRELAHRQLLGQGDLVRQFVVGRPVPVNHQPPAHSASILCPSPCRAGSLGARPPDRRAIAQPDRSAADERELFPPLERRQRCNRVK